MVSHATALAKSGVDLSAKANDYYNLAKSVNFDYAQLWSNKQADTKQIIGDARALFIQANPQYEQMEGIVAGTPSLSDYDVILDAGSPGTANDDSVVPFDLTLADGKVLPKPCGAPTPLTLPPMSWPTSTATVKPIWAIPCLMPRCLRPPPKPLPNTLPNCKPRARPGSLPKPKPLGPW
jgi:hypothetical protein